MHDQMDDRPTEDGEPRSCLASGVPQHDPVALRLDGGDLAARHDRGSRLFELAGQRPGHGGEIDDAGVRGMECGDAAAFAAGRGSSTAVDDRVGGR